MITLAVCDDESFMLDDIVLRLTSYMTLKGLSHQLLRFSSGRELLEIDNGFDLLFLDIQMDAPDGLETAKLLRGRGFDGLIIFTTVEKEKVFDSFEVEAFDYLLKPLEDDRLFRSVDRAIDTLENKLRKNIMIHKANTCSVIPLAHILYCEVIGRKIHLHTKDSDTADCYGTLEDLERTMDSRFFRCHRSYLINLDYVRGVKEGNAILSDGSRIPISRLREQNLSQALLSHLKRRRH